MFCGRTRCSPRLFPFPNGISRCSRLLPHRKRILLHILEQLLLCGGAMAAVEFCIMTVASFLRLLLAALRAAPSTTTSISRPPLPKDWNIYPRRSGKIVLDGWLRCGGMMKMIVSLPSRARRSWRGSWLMTTKPSGSAQSTNHACTNLLPQVHAPPHDAPS